MDLDLSTRDAQLNKSCRGVLADKESSNTYLEQAQAVVSTHSFQMKIK